MPHDFVEFGKIFDICRNSFNDSHIPCFKCANFQENRPDQLIGPSTGDTEDCCTGFMHYYNHPHYWSRCSSRFFQQHFVSNSWSNCMEPTTGWCILWNAPYFCMNIKLSNRPNINIISCIQIKLGTNPTTTSTTDASTVTITTTTETEGTTTEKPGICLNVLIN